jgi:hypothetical protein
VAAAWLHPPSFVHARVDDVSAGAAGAGARARGGGGERGRKNSRDDVGQQ